MPSEEKRKEASFPKVLRDKGSWEIYFTILFWFGMGYITTSLPFPTNTAPFQTQLSENGAFRFLTTRPLLAKGPKYAKKVLNFYPPSQILDHTTAISM